MQRLRIHPQQVFRKPEIDMSIDIMLVLSSSLFFLFFFFKLHLGMLQSIISSIHLGIKEAPDGVHVVLQITVFSQRV